MQTTVDTIQNEILSRLAAVRRKQNRVRAEGGLVVAVAVWGAVALVALVLEEGLYFGTDVRTVLFWLLGALAAALLLWRVAIPLLKLLGVLPGEGDRATAEFVGKAFPELGDRLVNILQLFGLRAEEGYFSGALIAAAFDDVGKQISTLDLLSAVPHPVSVRLRRTMTVIIAAIVLALLVSPSSFLGSLTRLWNHGQVFAAPQPFSFAVDPGNKQIVRGEDVGVVVRVHGSTPREVVLTSRYEGESTPDEVTLSALNDGTFRYEIKGVRRTLLYGVSAGSVHSEEYMLTVVDRPTIMRLRVTLAPPSYTGLPAQQLDDNVGDLTALAGSRAAFSVESTKELAEASLVFDDSTAQLLETRGMTAAGSLVLRRSSRYHLLLRDLRGTTNADPVEYTVRIIPDGSPTVTIAMPGMNLDVTDNTSLQMAFRITDDYGFSRLRLGYRLIQSKYEQPADHVTYVDVPLPRGAGVEALVPYTWILSGLNLVPEDVVSYYAEVFDNDRVTGPKSAVSETYTLRLPSLEEVYQDVDQQHAGSLEGMKNALQQAEDVHKELNDLQQELRKEQQKLDWQDQKKAESIVKKYDEIRKTVENANTTVQKMMEEMRANQVLSPQTMEKYQELQQLMEQLDSPELADALKKLQQSMQELSPEAMKQALQQFSFSEENFRKSLERTINLIKRLQIEAKVDELTRRTEELQKQQDELREQTSRTKPDERAALSDLERRERGAEDQMKQLRSDLESLRQKMEEFPREMPLDEMKAVQDSLASANPEQEMEHSREDLSGGEMESAAQHQQSASAKLGAMAQQMRHMKQSMTANQQQQVMNEMRRLTQDLLELSRREEELKNEARNLEPNSSGFRQNAQQQMEVLRDLGSVTDKMSGLSQKTFGVSPEMGKAMGDAMRQMGSAMRSLEQRNGGAASQEQTDAMGSLNEAAEMMEQAMGAMMQTGGQGMMGMSGFMQRLQQMSEQQRGINEQTRNLGTLTPEQASAMGRLAGEQGMVRKSLEQLQREATASGQLSKMLGDLRSIAEEMREVQTDLAQGTVNPETLRRQDRILSRLLESQRSTRERDYENRRRAEAGKVHPGMPPGPLDLSTQEGKNRLRQDLLKALQEGYARDYEDLIRRYFEALEHEEKPESH